jgi:hypothetical protein
LFPLHLQAGALSRRGKPYSPKTIAAYVEAVEAFRRYAPKLELPNDPRLLGTEHFELYLSEFIPKAPETLYGFSKVHLTRTEYHLQATGDVRQGMMAPHEGLARRVVIVRCSGGTQQAVVPDADQPDRTAYTVNVSPFEAASMASATKSGLTPWDAGPPNSMLICTVLRRGPGSAGSGR